MKATFIYEFPAEVDYQLQSAMEACHKQFPGIQTQVLCGFLGKYVPGGLHPARALNLLWVYLKVPFHILVQRPDWILVRSGPPGIQVWASLWAAGFGIKTISWLMDYHPEIEARMLVKHPLLRPLASALRMVDTHSLKRLQGVVTLDAAMAGTLSSKAPGLPVRIHPTWDEYSCKATGQGDAGAPPEPGQCGFLRLAYAGNLSMNHPIGAVGQILRHYQGENPGVRIQIHVIGTSPNGEAQFRKFGAEFGVETLTYPRLPFPELRETLVGKSIHYGILLMEDETAGLFSPSKFAGYLAAGIPLLYCGPGGTNADMICRKFSAGVAIPSAPTDKDTQEAARALADPGGLSKGREAVTEARRYFAGLDATTFIDTVASLLQPKGQPKTNLAGQ